MTGTDRVREATAELYSCDLDSFTERRGDLAARARAAGDVPAAKAIAGLRKPTRAAWAVNQVVRADPSAPPRLAALADELRAAEAALDGAAIRELSRARRQLIGALVAQALAVSGQPPPSAALREEVTATFAAALADPELAGQMAAATLVRAERRAGFGSGAVPVLAGAPSSAARPRAPAAATATATAAAAETEAEAAAARAQAERERERREAIAKAERAVADADRAADAAARAEQEQDSAVRMIEDQLAGARQRLGEARRQARQAEGARRQARQALGRLTR